MTPEGKVKAAIKKILKNFDVYYEMPVPGGYGSHSLDFICSVRHWETGLPIMFYIEAKAPGKGLTERQKAKVAELNAHSIRTFIVAPSIDTNDRYLGKKQSDSWKDFIEDYNLAELVVWLEKTRNLELKE